MTRLLFWSVVLIVVVPIALALGIAWIAATLLAALLRGLFLPSHPRRCC